MHNSNSQHIVNVTTSVLFTLASGRLQCQRLGQHSSAASDDPHLYTKTQSRLRFADMFFVFVLLWIIQKYLNVVWFVEDQFEVKLTNDSKIQRYFHWMISLQVALTSFVYAYLDS